MAAPLRTPGAYFDTSDGCEASSTLKPRKYTSNAIASAVNVGCTSPSASCATITSATADSSTAFILPRFSAAMMAGTISTNDTPITGR